MDGPERSYSTFDGFRRLVTGSLAEAALACRHALAAQPDQPVLIIDNASGRNIDVALEGSDEELAARLAPRGANVVEPAPGGDPPRGRGRPKLGVVPREVTLLPRHWEWLATQPGGASVTLRRLVEDARRSHAERDRMRRAQGRAYQFMLAVAGDLPGYEEATRALFANDRDKLEREIAPWPADVREHALMLAGSA